MRSIRELYRVGNGPSSSHTMGPKKAAEEFKKKFSDADKYVVTLFGSLALTGKGHLTDVAIKDALKGKETEIIFDTKTKCDYHPNTLTIEAIKDGEPAGFWKVYSVGGGEIEIDGEDTFKEIKVVYERKTYTDIATYCEENNMSLADYVYSREDKNFKTFLKNIWTTMEKSIERGLNAEGVLPGNIGLERYAKRIIEKSNESKDDAVRKTAELTAYAYAVAEENASGGVIVTAPTCGSSGVLPAVLHYAKEINGYTDDQIVDALAVAGLIGNIIKTNASLSGAECGCQAEIGSACSMAAAAYSYLRGLDFKIIEASAEIAMEHFLGLTCDPVHGYVQVPCIERNGVAANRAVDSSELAYIQNTGTLIPFDKVVETMYETGKDLKSHYRETSKGGLAKKYCKNKFYNPDME